MKQAIFLNNHKSRKMVCYMEDFITIVSNVGFPIAVTAYLLISFESVIKGLQQSITGLTIVIAKQNNVNEEQMEKF